MNWKTRIRQYDQSALEDLANAGLLRRAKKLCEAGKVKLLDDDKDNGRFSVADNTVFLFADFPARLNCDCKAAGVCVHTLAAVLTTQQADEGISDGQQEDAPAAEEQVAQLQQELLAISQQEIFKWAGKVAGQQAEKILLANNNKQPQCQFDAKSAEIIFDDEIRCRYVAGGGLAGIICAAPDSRRKGVVTACLLGWRVAQGEEIAWPEHTKSKMTSLSAGDKQLLQEIKDKLNGLLHAGLMHSTHQQVQSLRTLAWSAKGESFPQVSASVLHLAGAVLEYQSRSARIDTQYLLDVISRLWIQCERLQNANTPQLPELKGQARRTYYPRDMGKLWVLGASQYKTLSGAKGVSLVAWDINYNKPYRINMGRTVESAHSLNTQSVWELTLPWRKGCSLQKLAGQVISLDQAKASDDNRISLSKDTILASVEDLDLYTAKLQTLGITQWIDLASHFESTIAQLTPQFEPVLVRPDSVYEFEINEYEQQWVGWARDKQGELIKILLPVSDINNDRVKRINHVITHYGKNIWGIVLESRFDGSEIKLSPQSLILRDSKSWLCFSPDFEFFHRQTITDLLSKWINKIARPRRVDTATLTSSDLSSISRLFDQIDDIMLGAAELGLDCQLTNQDLIKDITSEISTSKAVFLSDVFEQLRTRFNAEHLLKGYFAFSLASRRLHLEHMIYGFKK